MTDPAPNDDDLPPALADLAAERLFAAADAADRERALAALVAEQPVHAAALRRFAQRLLAAEALLDDTFAGVRGEAPARIGDHRVVRQLGEGAFGVVYLCRQERPIVRDVAIKLLRPGAGDRRTLQRFAAERQVLATLNHPSITQVFDAGELSDGRPFVVMEFVDGVPIRAFCERAALPFAERLRLFLQLCRGVAHAHARGIVHRDLKPANVLVTDGGDGPLVKIIDFGIAKALHATPTGDAVRTDAGRVVGTPGYMSPEQAEGRVADVDARADVFALGVMLYELLTGELPWTAGAGATETDPAWPSRRVTQSADGAPPAGLRQRAAQLRGDLDWITLKALARERDDRYASVAALIADLERHLAGETVSVGPPALGYRLRKFVRRRRAGIAVGTSAVVLAAGLAAAFAYGSAKDAAVRDHLAEVRGVVGRLLQRANDPALFGTAAGDAVRQALSAEGLRFAEGLLANAPDDPLLQRDRCGALLQVSEMHFLLGEPTPARAAAVEAVRIAEALMITVPGDADVRGLLGTALRHHGRALALADDHGAALARLRPAIEQLDAAARHDPARHAHQLAAALREAGGASSVTDPNVAIADYERALAIYAQSPERTRREDLVSVRLELAGALTTVRRFEAAQQQLAAAEPELADVQMDRQRLTSQFHYLRGRLRYALGERATTLPDFEAAAAAAIAWRDAQPRRNLAHVLVCDRLAGLGMARNYVEDFTGSSAAYRDAIAAAEEFVRQFPDDRGAPTKLVRCLLDHAFVLRDRFRRRDLDEAAACIERAIEVDAALPPEVVSTRQPRWRLLAMLAEVETSRGSERRARLWREVEALLPPLVATSDNVRDHLLGAYVEVARTHLEAGEHTAAEPLLETARTCCLEHPQHHKRRIEVEWLIANCAAARGDFAAAGECGERIAKIRTNWFGYRRAGDCHRIAWHAAIDPDRRRRHRDRAAEYYRQVVKALAADVERYRDDPWYVLPWGFAQVHLAAIDSDRGDPAAARGWLEVALPALEAVRAEAHADLWDEAAWRGGLDLRESL